MADYPDYTDLMHIIGSDIMVPIDVQASYIMMPVDIQAQYVTLEIDIVAQSVGNISIDLAAQSVGNIEVDIVAQTIGAFTIDITAQHVGIYLQPDWNVLGGNAKSVGIVGTGLAVDGSADNDYEVPAGKTLYVTIASCKASANVDAEKDLNQMCSLGVGTCVIGGNGGCFIPISTPLKFLATETCTLAFFNRSNHAVDYYAYWRGYEI